MPVATYAGYVKSRPHRHAPDRRSCRDTEQQTLPAHRDCLFDIHCEVDRLVAQQLHGCSLPRFAIRLQNALSSIQGFVPDQRTLRGCTEPSSSVAFISFCHQLVGHELAPIRLSDCLTHSYPLVIRHRVDASAACLDLARILREFVLILARPGRGMFQYISERLCRHGGIIPQGSFRRQAHGASPSCSLPPEEPNT
jgi:hypothetical protein